jgi:hypothetical protein
MKFTQIAISAFLLCGSGMPLFAQNNVVIFGPRENTLAYRIRTSRPRAAQNFINFYAPLPKNRAVAELQIIYPQGMASIFHPDRLSVRNRRTQVEYPIREMLVDDQVGSVRIIFNPPISAEAGQELEIISEGGTNPPPGMYQVRVNFLGTEASPLFLVLGQWLVSIY